MAGEHQDQNWPLANFCFAVKFSSLDDSVLFQEISGLDSEVQAIDYRNDEDNVFSAIKMPGLSKTSKLTLRRGIFVNNQHFWNWFDAFRINTLKRETVIIQLLDENANPVMTWTLANAWPTNITASDSISDGNEVAIETMELAHEGLAIS